MLGPWDGAPSAWWFAWTAGVSLCGAAALAIAAFLVRRPRVLDEPISGVLILAAHQDDCVIMAGEYGIEAAKQGQQVRVVYLTCGSTSPVDPRAKTRRLECERAWAIAGVAADQLLYLDLPQSHVEGPSLLTEEHLHMARSRLAETFTSLPPGCAIFIPAAGESHCDHRSLRRTALEACELAGRSDVTVYETPEYNSLIDLFQAPARGLAYVGGCYPILSRLVKARTHWKRAGFAHGSRPLRLPPDPSRLDKKQAMLRAFISEGGEMLVGYFGYHDVFRPVAVQTALRRGESLAGYLRIASMYVGLSTILLLLLSWLACVTAAGLLVELIAHMNPGHAGLTAILLAGVGSIGCAIYAIRTQSLERRLTWLVCATGFVIAAIVA